MPNLYSTEQVSKYHPDKYADQVSDAILDACLEQDRNSRVAVETLLKGAVCAIAGEITTKAVVDYKAVVRKVSNKLGYKLDKVIDLIGTQSPQIAQGVDTGGAGDQGMMVGYATRETPSYLPLGFHIANQIIELIEKDVENNPKTILKGDAKTQVTIDLDTDDIHTILVSVCHYEWVNHDYVVAYMKNLLNDFPPNKLLINPAGEWTIGGPTADTGVTGRKIVCDQYGGYLPVGGGAFSGKDPTKVDRSASYMARHLAVQLLKKFPLINEATIQLAYAIGLPDPISVHVKTDTGPVVYPQIDFVQYIKDNYDLTPKGIINYLHLLHLKYEKIAERCHYYANNIINR